MTHSYNTERGFLGLPDSLKGTAESADLVIVPVPFDKTTSFGKGSDLGPNALIDASAYVELYDIETKSEPAAKIKTFTAPPVAFEESEAMLSALQRTTAAFAQRGQFVITLGGEHSITPGAVRGFAAHAREKFSVVQFDAHTDLRDSYEGSIYSHASAMARVCEIPQVSNLTAIGIRAIDGEELPAIEKNNTYYAEEIHGRTDWIESMVERLSPDVYITFDLDCFDPALVPSTGTPEPGGLDWYFTLRILRSIFEKRNVIGCDIVELAPTESKASDFLAAKLAYKMVAYKFVNRK